MKLLRKILLLITLLAALLPSGARAHENGPHHNYEVLVPGETLGLLALCAATLALLWKLRSADAARAARIRGVAAALLSGLLLYLSFPPFDLGWLAWFALVPMIVAQLRAPAAAPNPRARFTLNLPNFYQALTIGVAYALVFMHVFPSELPTGFPFPVWPLILLGVALIGVVFYVTGLPAGSMAFHRRTHFKFFILAPALGWMGLEQLRVIVELGQSWARIPGTQHANIPLLQLSALGGQWLIGALVIAANYALASFWIADARKYATHLAALRARVQQHRAALAAIALIIAAHLFGNTLIYTPAQTVRVAAIQYGEDLGDSPTWFALWGDALGTWDWKPMSYKVLDDFEPLIREAAARGAKVIALPEAMLWVDPALDLGLVARLTNLSKATGAYITFTFYLWDDPNSRNEVYTATPRGEFLGPYAKNHPIAYIGEYSATAGQFPVYQTPFGTLSNFVCYDNAYTDVAARLSNQGASLLTSANHDWPEGAWGFYSQSIFRAAENRVAIVRADWRVGSVIIDPFGRVVATTRVDEREQKILVADVPLVAERGTLYTRFGDWLAYLGVAVLGALLLAEWHWPRRLRTALQPSA